MEDGTTVVSSLSDCPLSSSDKNTQTLIAFVYIALKINRKLIFPSFNLALEIKRADSMYMLPSFNAALEINRVDSIYMLPSFNLTQTIDRSAPVIKKVIKISRITQ